MLSVRLANSASNSERRSALYFFLAISFFPERSALGGFGNDMWVANDGGGEAPTGYVNPGIAGKAYFSDINTRIIPTSIEAQVLSLPSLSEYPGES